MSNEERLVYHVSQIADMLGTLSHALTDFVPNVAGALLELNRSTRLAIDRYESAQQDQRPAIHIAAEKLIGAIQQ